MRPLTALQVETQPWIHLASRDAQVRLDPAAAELPLTPAPDPARTIKVSKLRRVPGLSDAQTRTTPTVPKPIRLPRALHIRSGPAAQTKLGAATPYGTERGAVRRAEPCPRAPRLPAFRELQPAPSPPRAGRATSPTPAPLPGTCRGWAGAALTIARALRSVRLPASGPASRAARLPDPGGALGSLRASAASAPSPGGAGPPRGQWWGAGPGLGSQSHPEAGLPPHSPRPLRRLLNP